MQRDAHGNATSDKNSSAVYTRGLPATQRSLILRTSGSSALLPCSSSICRQLPGQGLALNSPGCSSLETKQHSPLLRPAWACLCGSLSPTAFWESSHCGHSEPTRLSAVSWEGGLCSQTSSVHGDRPPQVLWGCQWVSPVTLLWCHREQGRGQGPNTPGQAGQRPGPARDEAGSKEVRAGVPACPSQALRPI